MSAKVRMCCVGAVAEGTIAPSGTWWTTLGPEDGVSSVSYGMKLEVEIYLNRLTLLRVEFAVKDSFDHVGSERELELSGKAEIIDSSIPMANMRC